jgi:hypothetical protein
MNKQRLAIAVIAISGMLATFMPWVKLPMIGSVDGTKGSSGWVTMALFAIPLIISLLNNRSKSVAAPLLYAVVAPALAAAIFAIWKIHDFNSAMSNIGDSPFAQALGATVSIGFGLYLIVIAGILLPIAAFALQDKEVAEISA